MARHGTRTCPTCQARFPATTPTQRFCSPRCWRIKTGIAAATRPKRQRRSTSQRGYGARHQAERNRWRPLVEAGRAVCWRCGQAIPPGSDWDLGHDDFDRTRYRGPEHPRCNRAAGARKGNMMRRATHSQAHVTAIRW